MPYHLNRIHAVTLYHPWVEERLDEHIALPPTSRYAAASHRMIPASIYVSVHIPFRHHLRQRSNKRDVIRLNVKLIGPTVHDSYASGLSLKLAEGDKGTREVVVR